MTQGLLDVEWVLTAFLAAQFGPIVSTDTAAMIPTPSIRVERVGGASTDMVLSTPTVTVYSFGATRAAANTLGLQVDLALTRQLPGQVVNGVTVLRVVQDMGPTVMPYVNTSVVMCAANYQLILKAAV